MTGTSLPITPPDVITQEFRTPLAIRRAGRLVAIISTLLQDTTRPEPPLEILARPVIVKGAKRILTSPVRHPRVQAH